MKQIPNLFTLLNLVFGTIAIKFILQNDSFFGSDNKSLTMGMLVGSFFLLLAGIVDFLDGFVARLFKATSAMGEQLDSLADAVSFGVAPGMILYRMLEIAFKHEPYPPVWWFLPVLFFPCAAVWRLAKFNLDKEQHFYFKGIPTPAAGLMVASLPVIAYNSTPAISDIIFNPAVLYSTIIITGILMISNLPIISLKFKSYALTANTDKLLLIIIAIVAAFFLKWAAVPVIFVAYVIVSLIYNPNKIKI